MNQELDIAKITELGRKVSCVLELSRVDYDQVRSIGRTATNLKRRNGHFVIEVPVDLKLLDSLGKIMVWSECPQCLGIGYKQLRLLPFLYTKCKFCRGEKGNWYESH